MQDRLHAAFSLTLTDSVEAEARRLSAELGDAASRAVTELPQLRTGLSETAAQLARAARAVDLASRDSSQLRYRQRGGEGGGGEGCA